MASVMNRQFWLYRWWDVKEFFILKKYRINRWIFKWNSDKMNLSAMMMHNQTQGHEVHLTSGEGWFCTTCDYDLVAIMEDDNDYVHP